jgi:hypothetical protein
MGDRLLLRGSTVNYFSKPPPELSHRLGLDRADLRDGQAEPLADHPAGHRDGQRIAQTEAHAEHVGKLVRHAVEEVDVV